MGSTMIRQYLVPAKSRKTFSGTNPVRYITVHETANTSKGATANAHARLQAGGNSRNASWHYQVDDTEIVQSYPDTAQCFHSGKGRDKGNLESIAIEICVNKDGNFAQAVANAQTLVRHLMTKHNVPLSNIVQHNHWSGKNCPTNLRVGGNWTAFIQGLTPPPPAPATPAILTPTAPTPPEEEEPDMHVIHANGGRYALVSGGRAIVLHAHEYQNYKAVGVKAVKLSDARFDQIVQEWK